MRGRVEICGINTAKLPVLKHEENMALLRRVKQGDEQARQELICGNLRLVLAAVKRFAGRSENVDDLFQVGCIGLMKSIDAFDLSYDVRLSSYSLPMIIGEIRRYLRDNSPIRVSRSVRDTAYRVLQARERLLVQQQREPTVEQIARELGIRREEVVFAMDAMADPVSLYEPLYDSGQLLAAAAGPEGCHLPADASPAGNIGSALQRGQDADGGIPGNRHLPGPGEPIGKGRHRGDQEKYVSAKAGCFARLFWPINHG